MNITITGPQGCGKPLVASAIELLLVEMFGVEFSNITFLDEGQPVKAQDFFSYTTLRERLEIFKGQKVTISITHSSPVVAASESEQSSARVESGAAGHRDHDSQVGFPHLKLQQSAPSREKHHTSCKNNCHCSRPEDLHADNSGS